VMMENCISPILRSGRPPLPLRRESTRNETPERLPVGAMKRWPRGRSTGAAERIPTLSNQPVVMQDRAYALVGR